MKSFLICCFLISSVISKAAGPGISDSIDIQHTTVHINITDFIGKTISGYSILDIEAKVDGITEIPLDLIQLTVSSVLVDGIPAAFEQVGETVNITFGSTLNTGDNRSIQVNYSGVPDQDVSWGGWYWSGDYSYQMGVGFVADPHNYGRIWFPCFDNFIERSTFTFEITTSNGYKAFCGGVLISETDHGDGTTTWTWQLDQPIPSYLASVAVSTYETVEWIYNGIEEDIPVVLGVKAVDSADLKNSFIHLNDALLAFENSYGAYMWDRVGYVVVPFGGGAMEHACNIAYPAFAVDGGTGWESLMSHELAHSWWGNLVTCSEASEMWLNEGWASFSVYLFTEAVYGRQAYNEMVNNEHLEIIHYGYANDGGNYFPLANMPHEYTYGYTTYTRGAMTVHNLRGYMGDELFFSCITDFLNTYAFQPVSSEQFRDHLSTCSGMDMAPFFDGWIFNAGTPAVEINYYGKNSSGNWEACIEQKLNHAPEYFTQYPIEVSLVDLDGHTLYSENLVVDAPEGIFTITPATSIPDDAQMILDRNNLIADAVTAEELYLTETGEHNLDFALMDIDVNALAGDTDWIRIEHYWVAADGFKTPVPGLHLNNQRYWRIMGGFDGTNISAVIRFNGQLSVSGGYLDNEFISNSDDSLVLLYRSNPQADWTIYPHYELDPWGNKTDKRGDFELSQLLTGEYAFGIYNSTLPDAVADTDACMFTLPVSEPGKEGGWYIYPNPASNSLHIETDWGLNGHHIQLFDPDGRLCSTTALEGTTLEIPLQDTAEGMYMVALSDPKGQILLTEKVLIIR